jgi:hypothetical protein
MNPLHRYIAQALPDPVARLVFLGLVFWLLPVTGAGGADLQWSGSFKSLNIYSKEAPADLLPATRVSSNRARLDVAWQADPVWQVEAALDYRYLWSDPPTALFRPTTDFNRRLDLEKDWQHSGHATGRLQFDRLNLQVRTGPVDMKVGRQAIGFGRIVVFSPLDVIAPFPPDAIDTDVRSGVDALQVVYNYGLDGRLGALAVWGEDSSYDSYLGTWTDNSNGLDLLLIGGQLRGRNMVGAGLAGSLGTLGLKAEVSLHDGRDTGRIGGDLYDSYALAAVEGWYRFDNGLSLITQYLYNGPGSKNPERYPAVLESAPLQEGLTALLGRNYLFVVPAYDIHPLATLQGLLIYNLDDQSALLRPTLELSLADNISLDLFWSWCTGERPRSLSPFLPVVPSSEFGLRGDSGGLFLKWYF